MKTIKLCDIKDNAGARKKSRPLGRGIGSGRGKTAGRGGKGQTARSGVRLKGFQGGQMPLERRLPKRGFTNIHRLHYVVINLGGIQQAIIDGRIKPDTRIAQSDLIKAGFFKKGFDGVRLLGEGELTQKIAIEVSGVSQHARKVIEDLGGSIHILQKKEKIAQKI
jgi:large subunit ribosomal protein L15